MNINGLKKIVLIIIILSSYEVHSETINVLKLSCKYDPNLIKKESQRPIPSEKRNLDISEICRAFNCEDEVEIHKINKSNGNTEYRLKNSWFNHQGILLDNFTITKNTISINTFLSQAYFLESYLIDRITGKTKRTFYRFDNPDFFYNVQKLEQNETLDKPLFNKKGKLSLSTIKSFSLKPWEILYFDGKCLEGTGV